MFGDFGKFLRNNGYVKLKSYPIVQKPTLEWKEDNGKHIGFYNGKFEYIVEEKLNPKLDVKMVRLCDDKYSYGWYKDVNAAKNGAEEKIIERFGTTDCSGYSNGTLC